MHFEMLACCHLPGLGSAVVTCCCSPGCIRSGECSVGSSLIGLGAELPSEGRADDLQRRFWCKNMSQQVPRTTNAQMTLYINLKIM